MCLGSGGRPPAPVRIPAPPRPAERQTNVEKSSTAARTTKKTRSNVETLDLSIPSSFNIPR